MGVYLNHKKIEKNIRVALFEDDIVTLGVDISAKAKTHRYMYEAVSFELKTIRMKNDKELRHQSSLSSVDTIDLTNDDDSDATSEIERTSKKITKEALAKAIEKANLVRFIEAIDLKPIPQENGKRPISNGSSDSSDSCPPAKRVAIPGPSSCSKSKRVTFSNITPQTNYIPDPPAEIVTKIFSWGFRRIQLLDYDIEIGTIPPNHFDTGDDYKE